MRKGKIKSSKNDINERMKIFKTCKKSGIKSNSRNKINYIDKKIGNKNTNHTLKEKLDNNDKMNKIIFIQNFWKNYLLINEDIYNKSNYITYINRAKARIILSKIKKILCHHLFQKLKYYAYNINYYFLLWHSKIFLKKILKKIIFMKNRNLAGNIIKNIIKRAPNHSQFKNKNLSSRQIRSKFNQFKELNTCKILFSNIRNNSSSIDKYIKKNKKINFFHKTTISDLSNYYSTRGKSPMNNQNQRNILIRGINNKKKKSSLTQLFRNNELDLNLVHKTKTPSNKGLKLFKHKINYREKNKSIEISSNNKIPYFNYFKDKNKNREYNNMTLKTSLGNNNEKIFNLTNYPDINLNPNFHKIEIKKHITLTNTLNHAVKNKKIKNKFYKIKKFDTSPLSFIDKKRSNNLIIKSKIKNYYNHWKSINFKNKLIKYFLSKSYKIKLKNIFYRKVIRIIMEHFQVIILKKYFDEYQNKSIKINTLFKLREYLLKSNKLKRNIDTFNKENKNYCSLNRGDIINNININNFINYNDPNKLIIPLQKNINNWNNLNQVNDFRLTFPYTKTDYIKLINANNELRPNKNYKIVKMQNTFSKGIIVDQINQLRMVFNLIQQNKLKKTNIKYYFNLWKKNIFNYFKNKSNYRKINILLKKIQLNNTRNVKQNIDKKYYERENIQLNYSNNKINKSRFQNHMISKFIDKENKNTIWNSSELTTNKNLINNMIIYTKKILKNNQIFNNNNNYRYNNNNNNALKMGKGFKRINKIKEMEIHFNSLNKYKNNSFNMNVNLNESAIKNKISKIKIGLMNNQNHKDKNKYNKIDYDNIFKEIKKSFKEKKRKINFKNVNQTFCCIIKNYLEEI